MTTSSNNHLIFLNLVSAQETGSVRVRWTRKEAPELIV